MGLKNKKHLNLMGQKSSGKPVSGLVQSSLQLCLGNAVEPLLWVSFVFRLVPRMVTKQLPATTGITISFVQASRRDKGGKCFLTYEIKLFPAV